jgi:hypothetical protein
MTRIRSTRPRSEIDCPTPSRRSDERSISDRGRVERILVILDRIHNQDVFRSDLREQDRKTPSRRSDERSLPRPRREPRTVNQCSTEKSKEVYLLLVILDRIHNQDVFRSDLREQDRNMCLVTD